MSFNEDGFAGRITEAEEERDFARVGRGKAFGLFELFSGEVGGVQAEVNLFGVLSGRVLEQHDFLREDLWFVLAIVNFADDQESVPWF